MSSKGMLPFALALEVKREIYDFLNVSFEIKATKSGEALKKYYTETSPLIQGPFVKISLPYEATRSDDDSPLSLKTKFPPYRHQVNAFSRLIHTRPQNTIVTTGTGSGKTECFLYPILDYVKEMKREGIGQKGIKAIILYPMNALLDDQGLRFIKTIKDHSLQDLDIRVGKYTGHSGKNRSMDYRLNKVIDHREELVRNPPDILLTNYKMLDYMLFRDQEKALWNDDTRDYLKYLVLDEMHTFDGAQGSDVACLIRRLKAVSGASKNLVYVGTSATLSSSDNAKKDLCNFASTLFGSSFSDESIITETKHTVASYLGKGKQGLKAIPQVFQEPTNEIDYIYGESLEEYVKRVLAVFNISEYFSRPSDLGKYLSEFEAFSVLIELGSNKVVSFDDLYIKVKNELPSYEQKLGEKGLKALIQSFLTLASFARHPQIPNFPFLTVKVSLWASELKQTLSKVVGTDEPWLFADENDVTTSNDPYLPAVYCTHCGESGWVSYYTEHEDATSKSLSSKPHTIRSKYADGKGCILFPLNERIKEMNDEVHYLYRKKMRLCVENQGDDEDQSPIPLVKVLVREGRCPACDTKLSVRFFSLGSSSLSTIIATSCFSHPLNLDRKLIAFSDSVQDASHQSAFLNNKAFSFSLKKFIAEKLKDGISLHETKSSIIKFDEVSKFDKYAQLDVVGKFTPDKLRKKWSLIGHDESNAPSVKMLRSVVELTEYNTFGEFTFNARLGWSFEKVGFGGFFLNEKEWKAILNKPRNSWLEKDEALKIFLDDKAFKVFLYGFFQRLKLTGSVYTHFLEKYYSDPKGDLYLASRMFEDLPLNPKASKPKFFSPYVLDSNEGRRQFESLGGKQSWYSRWLKKFSSTSRVATFYEDFCIWLEESGILLRVGKNEKGEGYILGKPRYVLKPEQLIFEKSLDHYECNECHTRYTAPSRFSSHFTDSPCSQRFCDGSIGKRDTLYTGSYFQRYFSQSPLRINASEHTGSFDPELKEKVEDQFKKTNTLTPNLDVNFLSCTPTMEMGIDIGDLSSVLLKSVPRTAANYLQRVGRSGRTTGNSLDFLVIDKKPHNLYFWLSPNELLNWEVVTPSCRYKTAHILQRQYNAYVMDQFLHTSDSQNTALPTSFQWLADNQGIEGAYWKDLFQFEKGNRLQLFHKFVEFFSLSGDPVEQELQVYVDQDGVRNTFEKVFKRVKEEITSIGRMIICYSTEISLMNPSDPKLFDKVEAAFSGSGDATIDSALGDFEEATRKKIIDLYGSIVSARRKRDVLLNPLKTYLVSKLADYGVLPGYAFPEEGCELEFSVRKPIPKNTPIKNPFYDISIVRGPEVALTDLAPYNHFYTHGFEAIIDRIGVFGKKDQFTKLGNCGVCGHISRKNLCDVCNNEVELHLSYDFKKAKASMQFDKCYVDDAAEKREKERYSLKRSFLFDAPKNVGGNSVVSFFNEEAQFGYEFQTNVEIFTFNEGFQTANDPKAFKVCKTCGAVADPKKKDKNIKHYHSCSTQEDDLESIKLYRQITSDAVRIPVLNTHMVPIMRTVFRRAAEINLKGNIGHITIAGYSQEGYEANTFVVMFDNVPGGTGHLRDLFGISIDPNDSATSPKQFLKMLQDVLDHTRNCPCKDGCYHCVWSADNIREKDRVTKNGVIFHLTRLLAQDVQSFKRSGTGLLDVVRESSFDGQTEAMLFHALNALGPTIAIEDFKYTLQPESSDSNSSVWKIQFKNSYCYLKSSPFESISLEGAATKPDFHVLNANKEPVGFIYTDGSRYHLNPGSEHTTFEVDIQLRSALSKEFNVPVLSFTYRELDELNNFIASDDSAARTKDFFEFNPELFSDAHSKGDASLKREKWRNLNISLLLRLFKMASGEDQCIGDKDIRPSFIPWAFSLKKDLKNPFIEFNQETRTFSILTSVDLRTERNPHNGVDTVPDNYYEAWMTFWQIFNTASMAELLRKQFKYKSIR